MNMIPNKKIVEEVSEKLLHGRKLEEISIREICQLGADVESELQKADPGFSLSKLNLGKPGLETPRIVRDAQIAAIERDVTSQYTDFSGTYELKHASHLYIKKAYNVSIEPQGHVVTDGAMMGCFLALRLTKILFPGDKTKVLLLQPGFEVNQRQARVLRMDYESLDLMGMPQEASVSSVEIRRGQSLAQLVDDRLSKGDIGSILFSSPNNPSWIILDESEYRLLAEIANRHDVLLIHDSAYGPMDFEKEGPIPTPLSMTENAILLISGSKMLSYAGERVGVFIAHPSLIERKCAKTGNAVLYELVQNGLYSIVAGVGHSAQIGLAVGLDAAVRGEFDIREHCREYERRGAAVMDAFLSHGFHLVYTEPDGTLAKGFYCTLGRGQLSTHEILLGLLKSGVSVVPLNIFGVNRPGIRACCSLMKTKEDLDLLLARLDDYSLQF